MDLLPIIIIVSMLGFFITLATILFTWQFLKARERRRKRRQSAGSTHRAPRQLTLRSGQVIPKSEAQDTASTRDPVSVDLPSPGLQPAPTYTVTCEAGARKKSLSGAKIAAHEHGQPPILADLEAQYQNVDRHEKTPSEQPRGKEHLMITKARAQSIPPGIGSGRKGSLTIPRPALVNIELRRPSASRSVESKRSRSTGSKGQDSQTRRSSREISDSLEKAFSGPGMLGDDVPELPSIPVGSVIRNSSTNAGDGNRTSERRVSAKTFDSAETRSRATSETIQKPSPSFSGVSYGPHVRFTQKEDVNRVSFLSTSNSMSSTATSPQLSPISPTCPTLSSNLDLEPYKPPSTDIVSPPIITTPPPLRDTPPHLATPEFGESSFFDSGSSSDNSRPAPPQRGVSVMSNRSVLTIASSDISTNWTIGNAQVVNIYPSVAQARSPPPYARTLRSKYGRYPRGRRDKALPVVPNSPLSISELGPL